MVIWISGPYGVGKSTLAEYMQGKMKYDPQKRLFK